MDDSGDMPEYMRGKMKYVLFPSLLAFLTIVMIATLWDITLYGIIFACFGSSAFIIYVNPRSEYSSVHNILGAYPLAGFFGYFTIEYIFPVIDYLLSYINYLGLGIKLDYAIAGGFAVGVMIFAMLITNFKHPPAAGAALAFVLKQPVDAAHVFFLIGGGITLLVMAKVLTFMTKEEYELEEAVKHALHTPRKKV